MPGENEPSCSCLHFISCAIHQLSSLIFHLSLAWFVSLKLSARRCSSAALRPPSSEEALDRLAWLGCKPFWGFLRVLALPFGERPFFSCLTEDASQSSVSERRGTKLSVTLSSLSHISLPTALEIVKLISSLPPSSQLSLSMINVLLCYLRKENPLLLMSFAVVLTWQACSPAGNPPLPLQCCLNTLKHSQTEDFVISGAGIVRSKEKFMLI